MKVERLRRQLEKARVRISDLEQVIASSAPLTWVNHRDDDAAYRWEQLAARVLAGESIARGEVANG